MEKRPENVTASPAPEKEGKGKGLIVALSVIAAILALALGFIVYKNHVLITDLQYEKEELTEQIQNLQNDYSTLSSDYESINSQLDSSRAEVDALVERIKKTDATNRAKIRQYQKELGTLRAIMKNYIVQIDSLNTLNHKLTADAAAARKETAVVKKQNADLQKTVEDLSGKVETGSIIHGRNIRAEAYNKNGKVVDRASSTSDILVSLSLTENNLAQTGPIRVYVVITDPEGKLLTNSESVSCTFSGETLATSASREVDYQGSEIDLGIYMKNVGKYAKGIYTVQVLTERNLLGTTQFMLR